MKDLMGDFSIPLLLKLLLLGLLLGLLLLQVLLLHETFRACGTVQRRKDLAASQSCLSAKMGAYEGCTLSLGFSLLVEQHLIQLLVGIALILQSQESPVHKVRLFCKTAGHHHISVFDLVSCRCPFNVQQVRAAVASSLYILAAASSLYIYTLE